MENEERCEWCDIPIIRINPIYPGAKCKECMDEFKKQILNHINKYHRKFIEDSLKENGL